MCLKQTVLTASLLTPLMLVGPWASAEEKQRHDDEHRQQSAHVHGIAALNLALEGQEVHIELDSPAANVLGFEHAPSSEADHAALDKAVATLNDGDRLFKFNDNAGCRMETAKVASELLDEEYEGHAAEKTGEHAQEEKEGHGHEEHEGDPADEGQHEHDGEGKTHSDVEAAYHFACNAPGKLTQLTVELFEAFPGMEELKVQYVVESKQGAAELTPTDHVVKF